MYSTMDAQRWSNIRRDFPEGQRVKLAPHLDAWMQGDRYGNIVSNTAKRVKVLCDSGKVRQIDPANLSTTN